MNLSKWLRLRWIYLCAFIVLCVLNSAPAQTDLTFYDLRLRLLSVQENDPTDTRDDSATVMVRTATMSTQLTITEYSSQFVDEYEIYVMYVHPNPERPGHGSARITVYRDRRY
jgi:hypothetical protein